jgi:hypothetical protein
MAVSAMESYTDFTLWGWTVEWSYQQIEGFADWLYSKLPN